MRTLSNKVQDKELDAQAVIDSRYISLSSNVNGTIFRDGTDELIAKFQEAVSREYGG
jgi:hypothetical protein